MKIVVVGELCKDVFVYGESKRLSPEAPVPVFQPIYTFQNDGMAGNVVQNLRVMYPQLGVIGVHQNRKITKTRYVDDKTNHMFLRVDEGDTAEYLYMTDEFMMQIKSADAVIVSDYDKGFLTEAHIKTISEMSSFCVLDTKKRLSADTINSVDFIKLNETEFRNNFIDQQYISKVLVTKGIDGTDYMDKNYPSPKPIQTMDVSGAGDTFTAAFTMKYLETKDPETAITFANEMASLVVSKRGVTTP